MVGSRMTPMCIGRVKVACHFPFWERKFYVVFALGSESSTGRKFQGAKVPGNESSTHGTFAPGSESTWERKFQLPFRRTYVDALYPSRHIFAAVIGRTFQMQIIHETHQMHMHWTHITNTSLLLCRVAQNFTPHKRNISQSLHSTWQS